MNVNSLPPAMTNRLYYTDSFLVDFTGRIVGLTQMQGLASVELESTAFYPTSGGQPHDVGRLGNYVVTDVFEERGRVRHLLDRTSDLTTNQVVECSVDWPRRFDHMQQHSGQHILSQAALRLFNAPTEGFHLSGKSLTVDLALDPMGYEQLASLEQLANQIVWEDRPVSVSFTEDGFDKRTRTRASLEDVQKIRVVDIAEFDRSACGGTHVSRTGQVGVIKILRWEKVRNHTRLHFACGQRALADYRARHRVTRELVGVLGIQESELISAVNGLLQTDRASQIETRQLRTDLLRYQAQEWLQRSRTVNVHGQPAKIAIAEVSLPEGTKLKQVASSAIEAGADIAVIGSRVTTLAAVIMCRSDAPTDCGKAVRNVCTRLRLKGGGARNFAQVGGFEASLLPEVMSALADEIAR